MSQEPTKVFIGGADCLTCQVDRIKLGFASIPNVELTDKSWDADLIYVNNPWFDQYIKDKQEGKNKLGSKLILNVQDLALQYPDYDLGKLNDQLRLADAITSISEYTRLHLQQIFALDSTIVYNPVKDVSPEIRLRGECPYPQFKALMVGRLNDPNKRAKLGVDALYAAGIQDSEIATIGPEITPYGTYLGYVTDAELNKLYNSVRYVMAPSAHEGQNLPPAEGLICGAIPILCQDMSTLTEFFPRHFGYFPRFNILALRIHLLEQRDELRKMVSDYCIEWGKGLLTKVSKEAVANNIWQVYQGLLNK